MAQQNVQRKQQPSKAQEIATNLILEQETDFISKNATNMNWEAECHFALQAIANNSYLADYAMKSPASLKSAIVNVATLGVSLNPAQKLAYLVPRDGNVILDISAKGLRTIAELEGSILATSVILVHEKDNFVYRGPFNEPQYDSNPFLKVEDRGDFIGACCVAKLANGLTHVELMTSEEIYTVRELSMAYKDRQGNIRQDSPWHRFFGEMAKKTLIKRAAKNWPRTSTSQARLETAIEVLNNHEGLYQADPANQTNVVSIEANFQYDESKVSDKAKAYAEHLIKVAIQRNGDFAGAKKHADDRLKEPRYAHDHQYVTNALVEAHESYSEANT